MSRYELQRRSEVRTSEGLALDLGASALQNDGDFPCHNTAPAIRKLPHRVKACIGAAIFLEHVREGEMRANRAFRRREGGSSLGNQLIVVLTLSLYIFILGLKVIWLSLKMILV